MPDLPANTETKPSLALCLSGGGYRAAIFHLGGLRRLNELGILAKVDTISSVSGGSILSAHLATVLRPWPSGSLPDWEEMVEAPFLRIMKTNIRTWPVLKRFLFPWNWFRPSTEVQALEGKYQKHLSPLFLTDLPEKPRFIFCATDVVFGVSWVFEKKRVGSYQAGYLNPAPNWPLARAVAASSCFPPVFSPLPISMESGRKVVDGTGKPMPDWVGMSVSDGGLYDNLGLQPVEQGGVLVSDGGQPFRPSVPHGLFGRLQAYLSIMGKQAGAIRKRDLIARFVTKQRQGTYWGVGSAVESYLSSATQGYRKEFATSTIAQIRTDLDSFSDAEIAVLMNHGYLLADIAIQVHVPQLVTQTVEKKVPFPEWMDEGNAKEGIKDSHEVRLLGRF